tara:strand:+ start:615 stop:2447 length:1833 start_codon:yes stop_codon:yes gene_type:complete
MMGPMAPPQAAPAQPQVLNVKNTPDQRLKFKDYMRGISSPPMPAPAPIMPMLPAPNPIDQVDIFDPVQGMASGGVVGGLEDLGKMSDQMVEALNTVVYGGGQGGGMGSGQGSGMGYPTQMPAMEVGHMDMGLPFSDLDSPFADPMFNNMLQVGSFQGRPALQEMPGYRGPPTVGGNMAPQNQMTKDFGGQRMTGDMEMYRQAQDDARRQRESGFMGQVLLPGEMSYEDFMGMRPGQEIAQLFEDGGDVTAFARGGPAGLAEDERAGFSFDGGGSNVIGGSNDTNSDNQDSFDSGSNNDEDPIEYMMTGKPLEAVFENTVTDLLNTVDRTKNDMIERIPDNSPYKAGVEVEAIPKAIDAVKIAGAGENFFDDARDEFNPLGELMGSKVSYGGRETNVLKDLERRADPSKNKPFGDMSIPGFGSALNNLAGGINARRAGKYLDQIANQGASAVRDPKTGMVVGYVGEGILGGRSYSGRAGYNPLGTGAVLDPLTNSYTVPFDDGQGNDMFKDDDPLPSVLKPVEEEDEIVLPPLDIQPPAPVVPNDPVDVVVPSPRRPVDVSVPVVGYPELPQNILDLLNLYNNQPVSSFADGGAVLDTAAGNFLQALRSAA